LSYYKLILSVSGWHVPRIKNRRNQKKPLVQGLPEGEETRAEKERENQLKHRRPILLGGRVISIACIKRGKRRATRKKDLN